MNDVERMTTVVALFRVVPVVEGECDMIFLSLLTVKRNCLTSQAIMA